MTDYVREKLTNMVKDMTEEEKELCLKVLKEWEQSEKENKEWEQSEKEKLGNYGFFEKRFLNKE